MGAGASQQYAAPYGVDPYFADESDPWRRRQGYPPPANYPGMHPALQLRGGTAAPPMHPAVQWGFAEAGKGHRIPQIVPTQAYTAAPAHHLVPQPHYGNYAQPYQYAQQLQHMQHTQHMQQPQQQHLLYQHTQQPYTQPRIDPHAAARLGSARSTAEVLQAAQMLELAFRQQAPPHVHVPQAPHVHVPQAPHVHVPQAPQAPLPAAPVSGGPSLGDASQLEYLQQLEGRVKQLEARLAAPPPPPAAPPPPAPAAPPPRAPAAPPPPAPSQYSAAPKRGIERKPQTAPRLHSRPKPAAPAACATEESFAGAEPSKWAFPEVHWLGLGRATPTATPTPSSYP